MTNPDQDQPVAYRVCNVNEAGQGRPLPDDPRFHAALDEMARAAVRLAKADRERQFQERLAAWLADRQATIAAALAALPAGMAPQTQAANVHAALLAAADVRPPAEEPDRPRDELVQEANVDARSPIQYLALDVLAARHRLGERVWTFPLRLKTALKVLAAEGLIGWKPGFNQGTALAWLTNAGRAAVLSESYETPSAPLATHYPGDGQTPVELTTLWSVRLPGSRFPVGTTRDEAKARQVLAEWRAERQEAGATGPKPELIRRLVSEWVPADAPTPEVGRG